jgi:AraC-like DNA-binding protein
LPPPNAAPNFVTFSTDDFPEKKRADGFREHYGRVFLRVEVEPLSGQPFFLHLTVHGLPGLTLVSGRSAGFRLGRTKALMSDGNDALTLQMSSRDGIASQLGREVDVASNAAIAFSNADVGSFTFPEENEVLALRMPREDLRPLLRDGNDALVRPVPSNNHAVRLLRRYLRMLTEATPEQPELQHLAVTHIYDLVSLALGSTREAAHIARGRGVPAARLRVIKEYIEHNLGDWTLSVETVALRHAVTPRYVQMLFEGEGTTFTAFVLFRRLDFAHRMLTDEGLAGRSISAIAFASGFSDLSYFNRTFRRRFDGTPSDIRAQFGRR